MYFGNFENLIPLKPVLGALTVLHISLPSMNSLNKTQTAFFTLLLHVLLLGDHITISYLYNTYVSFGLFFRLQDNDNKYTCYWCVCHHCQLKESVHAGNTTYMADNHPNNTKPRHRNGMGVNGYEKIQRTHGNKHALREILGVLHWNSQGIKLDVQLFNLTLGPSAPYKSNSVNRNNPSP